MPGQRTIRSTPLFRMTQDDQCTQFPKILKQNCSRSSPMTALSGGESLRPTDEQSSKNSGSAGECFEDAQGSATPRPPETNRPVPTPLERPQRCGHKRCHLPGGGSTPPPPALSHLPRPRPRPLSFFTSTLHSQGMDFAPGGSTVAT